MAYSDEDVVGIKEETLRIYSSDGESEWSPLPECDVNTTEKTVTCNTTHFSVFALFGEEEDSLPTVTTPTVTTITTTSAALGAQVVSTGVPPDTLTARGTCWGTTASPVINCIAEGGNSIGVFTHIRTGLTPNTTYYYRGYATNATGTAYSSDGTFTTESEEVPEEDIIPTVNNPQSSSITSTSATLSATVISLGVPANISSR